MQTGCWRHDDYGRWRRTTEAGLVLFRLRYYERTYRFNDDQETLFDLAERTGVPKTGLGRRERMEAAVRHIVGGYALRVGDYALDVGFNHSEMIVRLASHVVAEVYEIAVDMGVTVTTAGEVDWRPAELTPEDFYAA